MRSTEAQIVIETGEIFNGFLPATAGRLVKEWAEKSQTALKRNWECARSGEPLEKIDGSTLNKVVDVSAVRPFGLRVRFDDGASGVHDCAALLKATGSMIAPLRDPEFFARVIP